MQQQCTAFRAVGDLKIGGDGQDATVDAAHSVLTQIIAGGCQLSCGVMGNQFQINAMTSLGCMVIQHIFIV